jgi:uncharacterized membrane protein
VSRSDCRLFSLLLLSAAVLLDAGYFSIVALACVLLSLAFCFNGFSTTPRGPALPRWAGLVLLVCLGASTALYDRKLDHPVFLVTAALLVVAVLLFSLVRAKVAQAAAFALAALAGAVGIAATITWGTAGIDVFQFQQSASSALLHGHNPYTPLVVSPAVVAPGVSTLLHLHFPYGPILPVLEAPFRLLGDVRVLHILAALIAAAAVLTLARRAGTIDRAACVVMAFPLSVGMVMSSWVDIITMALLAVWLVNFRSHPRVATIALALALGAKPTTLIALVPIFFWSVRARRTFSVPRCSWSPQRQSWYCAADPPPTATCSPARRSWPRCPSWSPSGRTSTTTTSSLCCLFLPPPSAACPSTSPR